MIYWCCKTVFVEDFDYAPKSVISRDLDGMVGVILNKKFSAGMIMGERV